MTGLLASITKEIITGALAEGLESSAAGRIAAHVCTAVRERHGGGREYVPAPDVRGRNQRIIDAKKAGVKQIDIAKKERIHPSTVSRIISQEVWSDDWAL